MINNIKNFLCGILTLSVIFNVCCIYAFADTKNSQNAIGMVSSTIPYIQVELKNSDLDNSDVNGRLGSEAMTLYSLNKIK